MPKGLPRALVALCASGLCVCIGARAQYSKKPGSSVIELTCPIAIGSTGGGTSTLLKDTFTDANGTNIAAHVMDVGPGWSVQGGSSWNIQSNQLNCVSGGRISSDSGQSNVTASVDMTPTTGNQYMEIVVRLTDDNNFWMAALKNGEFSIYENAAGVLTQRATTSPTISVGTTYHVQLVASGTTMTATLNGGNQISYNNATSNQTATKCGIRGFETGTVYDNFLVTSGTGSATLLSTEPLGTQIRLGSNFDAVLKVTSAPSGGSPNLTVYFQHSADDGMTWQDFACVSTASVGTTVIPVSAIATGSASVAAIRDGALSANTAVQGPIGDRLRVKFSAVGGNSGFFMFQTFIYPSN
jgi:hypothetical protein